MMDMVSLLPSDDKSESLAESTRGRWIFALILVLITLTELVFAYQHSDFNNDDLDHFVLAAKSGLLAYMAIPVETVHIVPFHRLLTFLIYHLAPMNFKVALGLLGCIHGVTLYYLCRISRLLQAGMLGDVIVLCYALNILNIHLFVWWASAAHRIPYLALSACAVYHYLASLRDGAERRHTVIAVIAFAAGCGFYIKMVLVPFYLAVYGLAATDFAASTWRQVMKLPMALAGGSVLYLLAYSYFVHPGHSELPFALLLACKYTLAFFGNLIGFTLDAQFVQANGLINIWTIGVACAWMAAILGAVRHNRRVAVYLILLIGVVFLDFLPIAKSDRSAYFADIVPYSVRYHADALVIAAVLLLIIAATLSRRAVASRRKAPIILATCATVLYAVVMVMNLRSGAAHRALMFSTFGHAYMHNLRKGLREIHEAQPSFVMTSVPTGLDWAGNMTSEKLVPLFLPNARFNPSHGDYRLLMDGHVVSTVPK